MPRLLPGTNSRVWVETRHNEKIVNALIVECNSPRRRNHFEDAVDAEEIISVSNVSSWLNKCPFLHNTLR